MVQKGKASRKKKSSKIGTEALMSALNASPHPVMVERNGHVLFANRSFAEMAGTDDPQAVIGRMLAELSREARPEAPRFQHHAKVNAGGEEMTVHVAPESKQREQLERQLFHAQKLEALGLLVGGMAHDFNNLLTAINLHSDLMLARPSGDDWLRTHARQVKEAAERGRQLVQQVMGFVRQQPAVPEALAVHHALRDLTVMLRRLIGEQIELQTDFRARPDRVMANSSQLQQVVINLVVNARDAMPKGGRLTISTRNLRVTTRKPTTDLEPGDYLTISVADTGVGIQKSKLSRLFEPYFTTKPEGEGTGLGLFTVKRIVANFGGIVRIASRVRMGTSVDIVLPSAPKAAV